jgi:RNA polymerase sigma-70 factor (ECF subfamily)
MGVNMASWKRHAHRRKMFLWIRELQSDPQRLSRWMSVNADDHRLIAECLAGKTSAFGVLVQRYQDRLYNTVFRMVGNGDDALDIVQDAFLNAYQSLESFKGDALFFTWLYRIAMNRAISQRRKKRHLVPIDSAGEGRSLEPSDPSEDNQPGHALEQAEEEQRLYRALSRLSVEHRTVLVLKELEGQKYEVMAETLGVPVGTIRSRLHRARLELRDLLEQDEQGS